MSLRSWVELVTTIIMSDQNVSAETKEKLGSVAHEFFEEIESGLTSRAVDGAAGCWLCGKPESNHPTAECMSFIRPATNA